MNDSKKIFICKVDDNSKVKEMVTRLDEFADRAEEQFYFLTKSMDSLMKDIDEHKTDLWYQIAEICTADGLLKDDFDKKNDRLVCDEDLGIIYLVKGGNNEPYMLPRFIQKLFT